jgi:hypothetical protein
VREQYAIIEKDIGLAVAELPAGQSAEQVAEREGAILVDPGPYHSYEEAYDAILAFQEEEDDEDDLAV